MLVYDLLMVEEEAILNTVDPNWKGNMSLQEYKAFMISSKTESSKKIEWRRH